jgi:hypothetical protein
VLALAKFVGCASVGIVGCVSIVNASIIALGLHRDVRVRTGSGRRCMGAVRVRRSRASHRWVTRRPFGRLFDQHTVSSAIGCDNGYDTNVFALTTRAFGARRELRGDFRTVDLGDLVDVREYESNEYDSPHVPSLRQI